MIPETHAHGYPLSFSAFVSVGEGSHAGTHLEEVGEGALVAETQGVGYFANRHVGMGEEVAGFLVDERGDVLVDGRAAYLLDQAREVGRGDIHLAGVETDLALLTEVAVQVMEEDFVHLLLVLEVVGDGLFLVGQLLKDEAKHVEHRLNHLYLVDVLMSHDVVNDVEHIAHTLVLLLREVVDGVFVHHVGIYENTFRLEVRRQFYLVDDVSRGHDEEAVGVERLPLVLFADDYGGCAFPDEQEFGK